MFEVMEVTTKPRQPVKISFIVLILVNWSFLKLPTGRTIVKVSGTLPLSRLLAVRIFS